MSLLLLPSQTVVAQESDEFEFSEDAFEINPSQEIDKDNLEEVDKSRATVLDQKVPEPVEAFPIETTEPDVVEAPQTEPIETRVGQQNNQQQEKQSDFPPGLVEVRSNSTIFLPYKLRQDTWGYSVSLGAEIVNFPSLLSQFDDNSFEALFGSEGETMVSVEAGPKYNFSWGSLGLLFGYGKMNARSTRIGSLSTLDIQRLSATATLYLDSFFTEPYFVPYVGAGVWQSEYAETSESFPNDTREYSTEPGYHWRVGALLGLDWIDITSMLRARRDTGLTAMFINVYASSSFMSESAPDPDLENELDLGASLIFEF